MKTYTLDEFVKMFNEGIEHEDGRTPNVLWCQYMIAQVYDEEYDEWHEVIIPRTTGQNVFTYKEWMAQNEKTLI